MTAGRDPRHAAIRSCCRSSRDPRLHLAATIISLQVIGQVGFHFRVSIAQILIAIGTCAVLEIGDRLRASSTC